MPHSQDGVGGRELLSRFVGSRLSQPDTLRRVAAQWRGGPTASLRGLRIAHNDLQHGNVMVQRDGGIRLVDYDGMYLPQFRGERSPELGHKNYQHPERSSEHYDENVDSFPSLVIYLSLLAIASDPGLWDYHNEDNLIFTRSDYADPRSSEVFGKLKKSPDVTVARLAERLEECCALPVDKVPDLETALQDIPPSAAVSPVAAPSPTPTRPQAAATTGSPYRQALQSRQPTLASRQPPPPPSTSPPPPPTIRRVITPRAPAPAASTKDVLDRLEEAAGSGVAALKRNATSGEWCWESLPRCSQSSRLWWRPSPGWLRSAAGSRSVARLCPIRLSGGSGQGWLPSTAALRQELGERFLKAVCQSLPR